MDSDDSDEWATEELPSIPTPASATASSSNHQCSDEQQQADDESYWEIRPIAAQTQEAPTAAKYEGQPMLLVDMTELSKGSIHSKFDANAVNDPVAVKALRGSIEKNYQMYASNMTLVANRTVIPCGSTVWRPALIQMRKEKPGHYFSPIFPPKSE